MSKVLLLVSELPEVLWLMFNDESDISDNLEDLSDILVEEEAAEELEVEVSCGLHPYSLKYGCASASCAVILFFWVKSKHSL